MERDEKSLQNLGFGNNPLLAPKLIISYETQFSDRITPTIPQPTKEIMITATPAVTRYISPVITSPAPTVLPSRKTQETVASPTSVRTFPTETPVKVLIPIVTVTPSIIQYKLRGDTNGDNIIDGVDYSVWLFRKDTETNKGQSDGDFNSDRKVDNQDLEILLNNFRL